MFAPAATAALERSKRCHLRELRPPRDRLTKGDSLEFLSDGVS